MLERFRRIARLRVVFADVDMLRHANNLAYLRWAETARTEYFTEVIGDDQFGARGMILARTTVDYESELAFRERVAIGCRIARIGQKSFEFSHEIWSEDRGVRAAVVANVMVAKDFNAGESIAFPDEWVARIVAYEREPPEGAAGRGLDAGSRIG